MSSFPMEVGRVVFSRAGRDQGHYFVIVDVIDEDHVAIANGCLRKVDNPKKKKMKHLVARPEVIREIAQKHEKHEPLLDADVRKALASAGYADSLPPRKEG